MAKLRQVWTSPKEQEHGCRRDADRKDKVLPLDAYRHRYLDALQTSFSFSFSFSTARNRN